MKNFNKKYYIEVEATSTFIDKIELNASQFWNVKKQLDNNVELNKSHIDEDGECDEFYIDFKYYEQHSSHHTDYIYHYTNGCTATILIYSVCDEGYRFN